MSLSESLRWVMGELEESRGAAIIGMDGIVVEEQKKEGELDLQALGAEFSSLLRSVGKATESVNLGGVTELVTCAEQSLVLLRRVTTDYFLVLVIRSDGNLGKGRFLLRRAGAQLKTEL